MGKLVYNLEELLCLRHQQKYNIDEKPPCIENRHASDKRTKGKGKGFDWESGKRKYKFNGYPTIPLSTKNTFFLTDGGDNTPEKKLRQVPLQAWSNSSTQSVPMQEYKNKTPRANSCMTPVSFGGEMRPISPSVLYGHQGHGFCRVVHPVPNPYFRYKRNIAETGQGLYCPMYNVFTGSCLVSIGPVAFMLNNKKDFEASGSYENTRPGRNYHQRYNYIHRLSNNTGHSIDTCVDQKENGQHKLRQNNPYSSTGFFPESLSRASSRASKSPGELPEDCTKDILSSRDKGTLENDNESQTTESSGDSFNIQIKITS
ncbi:Piso0_005738 [Millerozyma farinosa CBS 7064]|uniref:Piso0_005738 protein n=1 Tax=Pichia sorbitophila (strain ATCC MYA-4447 / BCRC 22081 / CBS 7064 / NBRC 10061 / NRRL Y-12695) TaxID=559304 RepID=G8Y2S8_PICSO|nr:Piso0_005738 [Millerozyma farinosa CBS 7064]